MSDFQDQKLKTNSTFQNFLQQLPKNLSNIIEQKYGNPYIFVLLQNFCKENNFDFLTTTPQKWRVTVQYRIYLKIDEKKNAR